MAVSSTKLKLKGRKVVKSACLSPPELHSLLNNFFKEPEEH